MSQFSLALATLLAQDDDFIGSFGFFALMGVILIALVGVLLYLRNKRTDD